MTLYSTEIIVPKEKAEYIKSLENITGEEAYNKFGFKEDEAVIITAHFENGFEADIKLVIPDSESYTWTEAVLFNKGQEEGVTEPSDLFFGEWGLEDHNENKYVINVIGEE